VDPLRLAVLAGVDPAALTRTRGGLRRNAENCASNDETGDACKRHVAAPPASLDMAGGRRLKVF
jgi:hypothetical protein